MSACLLGRINPVADIALRNNAAQWTDQYVLSYKSKGLQGVYQIGEVQALSVVDIGIFNIVGGSQRI